MISGVKENWTFRAVKVCQLSHFYVFDSALYGTLPFSCPCQHNGIRRWQRDEEVNSEMVQGQLECVNFHEQDLGMLQGLV